MKPRNHRHIHAVLAIMFVGSLLPGCFSAGDNSGQSSEITECKVRMHRLVADIIVAARKTEAQDIGSVINKLRADRSAEPLKCPAGYDYALNPNMELWRKAFPPEHKEVPEYLDQTIAIVCLNPSHRPLGPDETSWLAATFSRRQKAIKKLPPWAEGAN